MKWEYLTMQIRLSQLAAKSNELGQQFWELVAVVEGDVENMYAAMFKRPIAAPVAVLTPVNNPGSAMPKPYTWEQYVKFGGRNIEALTLSNDGGVLMDIPGAVNTPQAVALMKIQRLIEMAYGGIPTFEERLGSTYQLDYFDKWNVTSANGCIDPIAFRSYEMADKFIAYPENCALLDEFYLRKDEKK